MTESAMDAMEHRLKAEFKADITELGGDIAGSRHDIQLVDAKVDMVVDRVDQRMDQGFRQIVDYLDRRL